ncbi:SCO3374 family protein [Streptomyces sp. AV19]|uniref:SCO3374 family protein n=1 Tax=Streptomyces sp. AV19 TaxID=2793068 RepID=UPI001F3453CA|nr:SCO3374 family protein [Streptomyces sp. AV19]MDG4534573.1 SCO3374 family protein [Streptomyces sp. AV19]
MTAVLPGPRAPLDASPRPPQQPSAGLRPPQPSAGLRPDLRRWYEDELGWTVTDGPPPCLATGVRFDALGMPAAAGFAVLGRVRRVGPAALDRRSRTLWFLTATGTAEELPELLRWLEWGGITLDLMALGPGGRIVAPAPVRPARPRAEDPPDPREAVWVRPPRPGCELEPTLPVTGLGGGTDAPDLVRLVSAAATECHRARLLRAGRSRRERPTGISRWPSRTPHGSLPGHGPGR